MTAAVELAAVTKRLGGNVVLDGLNLSVPAGSLTAVLGASGSGKTTLLRVIAGLERVDEGSVHVGGALVDDGRRAVSARHRGIGYVPQDAALFPHLDVRRNVGFGIPRAEPATIDQMLELTGLSDLGQRRPHQLSGGQQQRVALARALATRPGLVLLDEPFAALDAGLRIDLRRDVAAVLAATSAAAILVTHDQDEALAMADTIALLADGRLLAHGSPADLYLRPASPAVAESVGIANLLTAQIQGPTARSALGDCTLAQPSRRTGPGQILLRPEQIRLTHDGPGTSATVLRIERHGHDSVVELELPGVARRLIARIPGEPGVEVGQRVSASAASEAHAWLD